MKNEQLIKKILKAINYKSHKLSKPVKIDEDIMTDIVYYQEENTWYICCEWWEVLLNELTNRELIKVYQSL